MNNNLNDVVYEITCEIKKEEEKKGKKLNELYIRREKLENRLEELLSETEDDGVEQEINDINQKINVIDLRIKKFDKETKISNKNMNKLISALKKHRDSRIKESHKNNEEKQKLNQQIQELSARIKELNRIAAEELGAEYSDSQFVTSYSCAYVKYSEVPIVSELIKYIPDEYKRGANNNEIVENLIK